jgi:hypothetical protein
LLEFAALEATRRKRPYQFRSLPSPKLPPIADLVTLGVSGLESAITQQLVEPLDSEPLTGWEQL